MLGNKYIQLAKDCFSLVDSNKIGVWVNPLYFMYKYSEDEPNKDRVVRLGIFEDYRELARVIKEVFTQIQEDTEFCNFDITWLEVIVVEDALEKKLLREEVLLL